ncbi:MAG: PGF-pre-PGF domain-containing protein [Methanolobus sp.]
MDEDTSTATVRFDYNDSQTGVNTSSIVFKFDSVDVTGDSTITDSYALYDATGLEAGSYSASLYVVDNEGNAVTFSTSFTISEASSSSSSSGGGGGGGGGGGTTGELYENILVKEAESIFVNKGGHITYEFTDEDNAISTVEFDSLKNSGTIQAIVEVLKESSSFADADVPGQVYQEMNIWVGKVGFVTPENVENLLITFRVEKSWLTENNIESDTVMLYRYDDSWGALPTTITDEDDEYVYYESETPGFSPFAIASETEPVEVVEEELMSVTDENTANTTANAVPSEEETSPEGISAAGIIIMLGFVSLLFVGAYLVYGKRS